MLLVFLTINNVKHILNTKIKNTKHAEANISTPRKNYRIYESEII